MRWERLFEDLEAALREQELRERQAEVADRTRHERGQVTFAARLLGHHGTVELVLRNGPVVRGRLADHGADWLAVIDDAGWHRLIPLAAIVQAGGLTATVAPAPALARRFPLSSALRALSRDRCPVQVDDVLGRVVTGTIDAVGADYLELSEHPLDVPRRAANVLGSRLVLISGVTCVSAR
jgi:hypothetical protein